MIRLERPNEPATLAKAGPAKTRDLVERVQSDWDAFCRPNKPRKLPVKSSVYGAPDVRAALEHAQHGKCAYCEHPIGAAQSGDVEHFRPKGASKQHAGDAYTRPGYYWLTYTWANLLLACSRCNGAPSKGNQFPIAHPENRARRPEHDLDAEGHLLVDPFSDSPDEHVSWDRHDPKPLTERGRATIAVCRLGRPQLGEARMGRIQEATALLLALRALRAWDPSSAEVALLEEHTPKFIGPAAPFSAAVRAACAGLLGVLNL